MGSPITAWEGATAIFTGAGGVTPGLFLLLSVVVCVAAIYHGAKHETHSYERNRLE